MAELALSFCSFTKFHYEQCGNYLVLAAEYYHLHSGLLDACGRWPLTVYAVPRKNRHAVNNALVSAGLPVVEEWLCDARTETWLDSYHRIELEFNADSGELLARNAAWRVTVHGK